MPEKTKRIQPEVQRVVDMGYLYFDWLFYLGISIFVHVTSK